MESFPRSGRTAGRARVSGRYNVAVAFVIRDFKSEDFETLWRLDQACFPPGIAYSKQELTSYVRLPEAFTLIATGSEHGEIAGFIVVHQNLVGHVIFAAAGRGESLAGCRISRCRIGDGGR